MNSTRFSWRILCMLILAAIAPCLAVRAASLELPPVPYDDVDGLVTVTWGPYPGLGIPPESSLFTIDIQPAGGPNNSPLPPIAPGRYAAWCFDAATDISPADSGTLYGGYLFSTTDPLAGFNAYLPNHPGVIRDAATWKKINYLINHRHSAYAGFVPTMWEVQNVIYLLVGQTPPGVAEGYPPVRSAVVQALLDTTNTQAPSWELGCDDKVAVIFNIDVNWDAQQPDVQLLFLEVPASCASIGNFVWNDTNANGKQDAGEPGIPGVTVELHRCIDDLLVGTTTTDANGLYLFSGFPPGDYHIKVIAPAGYTFTTANAAGTTNENDSDANASGIMPCTTLSAGENDLSWDAGLFQVVTIGNFVWLDQNGNGVQDSGEPGIPNVTLTLTGITGGGIPVTHTTVTDANGLYSFTEQPGTYTVTITPPSGMVATAVGVGGNATDSNASPSATTPVSLPGGSSDQTIDFGFYQPVTIGNFVWNDQNANGVQDAGEPGIPGVTVTLTGTTGSGSAITLVTTTNAGGNYGFVAPPGTYTVTVTPPPGYLATTVGAGTAATDSNSNPSGTSPLLLPGGSSDQTIDFGFYRPVTIGNFVWKDQNANGIQDAGEPGIPGVTLTLTGTTGGGGSVTHTTTTDASGFYAFTEAPGTYSVAVSPPGGYIATTTGAGTAVTDSNASPSGTTPLNLPGGASDQTIDFGFYQLVTVGNFVWHDLNANGVQDGGEPGIPNVSLTLTGTTGAGVSLTQTTTTDASGLYGFTAPPGSYTVSVTPPVGYAATATGKGTLATDSNPSPSNTAPVVLPGGGSDQTIDFGFYRTASLGDFVWNDTNANGIQDSGETGITGLTVTLLDSGPDGILGNGDDTTVVTTTGSNGFYKFSGLIPGRQYQVQFSKPPGRIFTVRDASGNSQDALDSDADTTTGRSQIVVLASGEQNLTIDAGVVEPTPGIMIVKDAGSTVVGPNTPVTYTYSVYNTGGVPLWNIMVVDDNATPDFPGDDFNPKAVEVPFNSVNYNVGDLNHDNKLDTDEVWKFSATVIPAVQMTVSLNGNTYESGTLSYQTLANGDVRVYYRQSTGINDNTYGTGAAADWPNGHKFGDLTGSDKAGFDVKYSDGTPLVKFYMDYISASGTATPTYSGYQSLGYAGGDGSLVSGNASVLKDFDSTEELNLNRPGYTTKIVDSPVGDPNWDVVDGYYFTISAAAFTGGKSFGGATIFDQHNSPSKLGVNSLIPSVKGGAAVNTATVTGTDGNTTVTDEDDATVIVLAGPLGSIGDRVWFDANANGVQDSGEPGISGVKVTLQGDFDKNGTVDYTATATTDANGLYTFTGLPAGAYKVIVDTTTLPANYTPTFDLDGLATPNLAVGELTSGQNRTDFDFGYVASAPGFGLLKTASKTTAGFGEKITYTYQVFNNGGTPLTNVVLRDDNATPDDPTDDFSPTYVSGDTNNSGTLDPGELWTYTATVTPPISLSGTVNGQTIQAGMLSYGILGNGDIRITYRQNTGVNDNTYGINAAADWPNGHKFGDLTGSDKAGFELKDANGQTVIKFYMDYISAATTQDANDSYAAYSGYRSLGATGGDGSMVIGSATNLYDFDTTLELNLNRPGYTNKIVDSPVGDPNWDIVDGYTFTVKASAFGAAGFGSVSIFDQHNSPSKLGVNSFVPTATGGEVTNTAIVTAKLNGNTVVSVSDASVVIGQSTGSGGTAKFVVVDIGVDTAFKYSAAGSSLGSFHLQAGNNDARDVAANVDGSKLWVLDKTKNVNVYLANGTAQAKWKADGLGAEPEGITVDGADIWTADRSRKIYWYKNATTNATGITDKPEKTLAPAMTGNLKGIVTDGTYLWVVTEGGTDYVYRFLIVRDGAGTPTGLSASGQWKLPAANAKPTGITLDPTGASQSLWIVDESSDSVYEYANARSVTTGTGVISNSFKLGPTNLAAQGLADPR